MARLMLVVLMWGVVRGEEYGGGGIPHYGGAAGDYADPAAGLAPADYTGHSPDAPAALDYKYVEDPHVSPNKIPKEVEVPDRWQKPKKRRQHRHEKDNLDAIDAQPHFIKHRSNHRPRYRSRLKNEKRSNAPYGRRRVHHERDSDDNVDDDNNQYRDEVKTEAHDDIERIALKLTTERIIRRKPRDRRIDLPEPVNDSDEDEFIEIDNKPKDEEKFVQDYSHENQRRRGRPPPPMEDDEFGDVDKNNYKPKTPRRKTDKNYRDYNDYYDMKRVYNIKNRLPMLIRRTSTWDPIPRKETTTAPKELLDLLAGARRAGSEPDVMVTSMVNQEETEESTTITPTTPTSEVTIVSPIQFITETTTAAPPDTTLTFTQTQFILHTLSQTVPYVLPQELSLAEKSRLSILKKAQRKEKDKANIPTKPPILLQVTNKLPTVVMVEPQKDPWLRAREVSDDSPAQLEKVKQLMRNKIVAQAKDIKDLTDNWNDMVCDYIDTSMISSRGCNKISVHLCLFHAMLLLHIFYVTVNVMCEE